MFRPILNTTIFLILLIAVNLSYAEAPSEEENSPFNDLKTLLKIFDTKDNEIDIELKKFAINLVQDDPELANKIFELPMIKGSPLGKFIEDANLKLKVFDSGDEDESASLGFSYSYAKNYQIGSDKKFVKYSGFDISIKAIGNVAFDNDFNPKDFLDTKCNIYYFSSRGGVKSRIDDPGTFDRLDNLNIELTKMKFAEFKESSQWREYKDIISKHLTDQYFFDVGIDAGMESDQSFDSKQYTFGLKTGLVSRGWSKNSILGRLNVLDYIPAFIRQYSAVDDAWQPRGSSFPSFLFGIDRVAPEGDDPRNEAGDDTTFSRFKLETSFKTQLTVWNNEPVYLESNFRFYREFNASQQVKAAELDNFTYFSTALRLPKNLFVSYSTGKLPLNESNDKVYEAGFSYNF